MKIETDITPRMAAYIYTSLYHSSGIIGRVNLDKLLESTVLLERTAKILGSPTQLDPLMEELGKIMLEMEK